MDMARYIITRDGLIAALTDPRVLKDITALISGDAPKTVEKEYLSKGLVSPDRRTDLHVDEHIRVLGEALVNLEQSATAKTGGRSLKGLRRPAPAEPTEDDEMDASLEEVRDLRRTPRKIYRLSPQAERVTTADLKALPAGARQVFAVLRKQDAGTTATITESSGLNRRTVENSLGALRKAGLLEDIDFKR